MKKPSNLRAYLLAKGLSTEQTTVVVDRGQIINFYSNHQRPSGKHKIKYDLQVLITDYPADISPLSYWITQWVSENIPNHKADNIRFEVDILNHDSVDILFTISDVEEVIIACETEQNGVKGVSIATCEKAHHLEPKLAPKLKEIHYES